jgi:hypothetical protein
MVYRRTTGQGTLDLCGGHVERVNGWVCSPQRPFRIRKRLQTTDAALLDELNHSHLFAQPRREKALGDHGVDAAHDVNNLRYPKAYGDTAQSIGIELG